MKTTYLLIFAFLALFVPSCLAGCYRDKSLKKPIPQEKRFFHHKPAPKKHDSDFPRMFNWCDNEGVNYCTPSWNQHIPYYCGACWAHASLSMIQDRLKILKNAQGPDVMLGRQTLLNCAALEGYGTGCDGGDPIDVFHYMAKHGLPDEGCVPYNATDHTKYPGAKHCPPQAKCMNCMPTDDVNYQCWSIPTPITYYLTSFGHLVPAAGQSMESAMMSEILYRGPITCGIACPDRFVYDYHGGIFKDDFKDKELDHDIEVVGWGEERGEKFWVVRNSWGAYWGELGFFRVQRGVNALQIESGDCWYAVPEHKIENQVARGKKVGSMYGLEAPNVTRASFAAAAVAADMESNGALSHQAKTETALNAVWNSKTMPASEFKRIAAAAAATVMRGEEGAVEEEEAAKVEKEENQKGSKREGGRKGGLIFVGGRTSESEIAVKSETMVQIKQVKAAVITNDKVNVMEM